MDKRQVIIIGGGPAGLAAAAALHKAGITDILILERERRLGGILNQCIHDGFGLIRYGSMLTGPEYAHRAEQEAAETGAEVLTGAMVTGLTADRMVTAVTRQGLLQAKAGAVVLATGCRERTRGAVAIPGTRPAGIYTAGAAQNLMNAKNLMVGKQVVILGSGDIGLIMARRLTLEGATVLAVIEARNQPSGLERNVSQCLFDFGIPLYLGHTITDIQGRKRLEAVTMSRLDENNRPIPGTETFIPCDTLLLSVGLIPENEIAAQAGAQLDPVTNGTITDAYLQTSVPGIFACGNSRKVLDLADFVSLQGFRAGRNAAAFGMGLPLEPMPKESSNAMAKGLPKPGAITCIQCPKGCRVTVSPDGTTKGNTCPKGEEYALQEQKAPKRVLTTTLLSPDGLLMPVKTSAPIPKDQVMVWAEKLRTIPAPAGPIRPGQILLRDPFGMKVDILATGKH